VVDDGTMRRVHRRRRWWTGRVSKRSTTDPRTYEQQPGASAVYAELHCHSNFSFLDGASHPEELAEEAARLGLAALALTDHDGFYGVVRFAEAARAARPPDRVRRGAHPRREARFFGVVSLNGRPTGWPTRPAST
jgi:hypothetical protein